MADSRTLDELDPPAWGPAPADATGLVRRCHELRARPLDDWDLDDLRLMVGQQISLSILMPRAIEILESNPLAEAGYPGDLLSMVLAVDKSYWQANVDEWSRVDSIVDDLLRVYEYLHERLDDFKFGAWR